MGGSGGGDGAAPSFGPGGGVFKFSGTLFAGFTFTCGANDACIAATLGSDSAVNLPLESLVSLSTSLTGNGAVSALFDPSGLGILNNNPSIVCSNLPCRNSLVTDEAMYTLLIGVFLPLGVLNPVVRS